MYAAFRPRIHCCVFLCFLLEGDVPTNGYGNVELWTPAHLPRGCIHIPYHGVCTSVWFSGSTTFIGVVENFICVVAPSQVSTKSPRNSEFHVRKLWWTLNSTKVRFCERVLGHQRASSGSPRNLILCMLRCAGNMTPRYAGIVVGAQYRQLLEDAAREDQLIRAEVSYPLCAPRSSDCLFFGLCTTVNSCADVNSV